MGNEERRETLVIDKKQRFDKYDIVWDRLITMRGKISSRAIISSREK